MVDIYVKALKRIDFDLFPTISKFVLGGFSKLFHVSKF